MDLDLYWINATNFDPWSSFSLYPSFLHPYRSVRIHLANMSVTTLLPSIGTNFFSKPVESNGYHTRESSLSLTTAANGSSSTLGTVVVNRVRQASPAASLSLSRVLSNIENLSPLQSRVDLHNEQRTTSLGGTSSWNVRPPAAVKRWASANTDRFPTGSSTDSASAHGSLRLEEGEAHRVNRQLLRKAPREKRTEPTKKTSGNLLGSPPSKAVLPQKKFGTQTHSPEHLERQSTDFDGKSCWDGQLLSDAPEQRQPYGTVIPPLPAQRSEYDPSTHRKRPSTVSSRFVHTVKTASLTNTTISFLSRSLRLTHSSDLHSHRGSDLRHSIDSDRPPTTSSVDEAAMYRGVKRRQIIEEIITSEEGYVADLKALVFLYSTLLASSSSLSNRTRASIQRNVIELLHLHEHILDHMRRLSFISAQRKWFDTASLKGLGISHHIRWRSLDSRAAPGQYRSHRHTKTTIETSNPLFKLAKARAIEPAEAAKMARLFGEFMPRFDAYEEFCAKHLKMMHELHERIPAWLDYGMGIESLAQSITSIDHRASKDRKALTLGDLLMKPIQRICKYPLLLAELLKQTPVVDGPDAHAEIEATLGCFRDAVQEINLAADSPVVQAQIERRWMLHERLTFHEKHLRSHQFRMLGHATHCGVLHVAYQTKFQVDGSYALCILFASHLLLALPSRSSPKFMILAVVHLSDLKLESCTDGKGMAYAVCICACS